MSAIASVILVIFVGIPSAIKFYPQFFTGLADGLPASFVGVIDLLPINLLLTLMTGLGIILFVLFGILVTVSGESKSEGTDSTLNINRIIGCIEKEGVAWRCRAKISDGNLERVQISREPRCPRCQTEMNSENRRSATRRSKWKCPNSDCGHRVDYSTNDDAEKVFRRHIERILNSDGESYSLESLKDNTDGKVTEDEIWKEYIKKEGDKYSDISDSCFL